MILLVSQLHERLALTGGYYLDFLRFDSDAEYTFSMMEVLIFACQVREPLDDWFTGHWLCKSKSISPGCTDSII